TTRRPTPRTTCRRRRSPDPRSHAMRITQGTFSFLPPLSDEQILKQLAYCLDRGWAIGVEYTDDPHPRNTYWEMHGMPMFDLRVPAGVMLEIQACRDAFPEHYSRVTAFDSTHGTESVVLSFIVNRPSNEPGFGLVRQEGPGRTIRYTTRPYATERPAGER